MRCVSFLNAGDGGVVNEEEVIAIGRKSSAPISRAVQKAEDSGRIIDLTYGKMCHWVVFTKSGFLILANKALIEQILMVNKREVCDENI